MFVQSGVAAATCADAIPCQDYADTHCDSGARSLALSYQNFAADNQNMWMMRYSTDFGSSRRNPRSISCGILKQRFDNSEGYLQAMSLPEPKGRQHEIVNLPEQGHTVVLGTAGSGKTTMAILRANYLATLTHQNVLLVTFNRALVTYLKVPAIQQQLSPLVCVENYHLFACGYLTRVTRLTCKPDVSPDGIRIRLRQHGTFVSFSRKFGSQSQIPVKKDVQFRPAGGDICFQTSDCVSPVFE